MYQSLKSNLLPYLKQLSYYMLYNLQIVKIKIMSKSERVTKYAHISYEKRLKIVQMVLEQGYTIQKTSDTLGINASTARMILKKYKDEGKIFERKDEQKVRQIREQINELKDNQRNEKIEKFEVNNFAQYYTVVPQIYYPISFVMTDFNSVSNYLN